MALKIGELYALITAEDGPFSRALTKAEKKLTTFGGALQSVGKITALATLASTAVTLVDALAPAAGAALALPAAMGVAAAAATTLKVGMSGVGDAMKAVATGDTKKLNDALKGLAPNAQRFVRSWAGIRKSFGPIQQAVQQRLFAGLDRDVRRLAAADLPILRRGMTGTASSINALGREGIKAAATPLFRGTVAKVFGAARTSLNAFRGSVGPLVTGVGRLVGLGTPLLSSFASWAAGGARAAGAWLNSAHGAATLSGFLQRSIGVIQALGRIAGSLGRALVGIFKVAAPQSGQLLKTIEQLAARFAAWVNSAAGQSQLTNLFTTLGQVAHNVVGILPLVSGALTTVLGVIGHLPGPVRGVVTQMLAWAVVIGPLASKFGPLVSGIGSVVRTVPMLVKGFKLVGVGFRTLTALFMTNPWLLLIAAIVILVVLIVTHWNTVKRVTVEVWNAIYHFISSIVSTVVGFIRDHWRLIIAIIGGPLGLAVALVTKYWHQIWSFVQAAVRGVLAAVGWLNSLPGKVASWFGRMASAAISKATGLLSWMRGLPGRILHALGSLGSLLYNAGKSVISGLIRGIESQIGWLKSKLSWVTSLIPSWKGPMSVDLRLLQPSGRAIMSGLMSGITAGLPGLHRTLAAVTDDIGIGAPAAALAPATARTGGGERSVVQLVSDGSELGRMILELIRNQVRVRGGNVQVALGQ